MPETTTKKTTTRKKPAAKAVPKPAPEKLVIEKEELIPCINVFAGQTILIGKRYGNMFVWNGVGDVAYIPYEDLRLEIMNRNSSYIYSPLILIDDERVLELHPKLKEFYNTLEAPENFETILLNGSPTEIKAFMESQPKGMRSALRSVAADLAHSGELVNIKTVKVIDEVLGTDLLHLIVAA